MDPRATKPRWWAAKVAGLVHDLHRVRIPFTRRAVRPLNVKVLEAQLIDLHEVMARQGVPFWLRDGTALGVVRDGRLIPYDDDVDVGLWAESRVVVEAAVLPELVQRGFVVYKNTPFVLGLLREWETTELCFSAVTPPGDDYEAVREAFFRELAPVRFLGREFLVPRETERYLEFSYGADWRVPKNDPWSNTCWRAADERQAQARAFAGPRDGGPERERFRR